MLRSAALRGVFGFVLVVIGLVVFDDVILATEESDHTWGRGVGGRGRVMSCERPVVVDI